MTKADYVREILFYAECQLQGMIAENKMREHRGESPAYVETDFINLQQDTQLRIVNLG